VLSNEIGENTGKMLSDAQKAECKRLFAPVFLQLVDALRDLVEFPEDSDSWKSDEQDDFKRFRYSVGDAINDACQVATSVAVIERLFLALQSALPAFSADHSRWREIEGYVYCLRQSGTKDPSFFSCSRVGEMLQLLPTLPMTGELTTTAIRTVGTYADWLNENSSLLPPLLVFVSQGLSQDRTAAAASQAMKQLCEKCAEHLAEEQTMQQLLQMYHGTLQLPALHCADRVDLIAALSFVVSQMPLAQVLPAMQAIAHPLLTKLQQLLHTGSGVGEVAQLLDQICSLLREVSPVTGADADTPALQDAPHPSVQMLQQIWEVLDAVFSRHGGNSTCMEKLTRCYKHTAKNCRESFGVLVPTLLQQITGWFEQQPHSCFIYVINWCLSSFSQVVALHPLFAESFGRISNSTFQLLSATSTITDNPDVVDDYFELCSKTLRFLPPMMLETPILTTAFQCGCAGMHILHREAGRSVTIFFETLISLQILASGRPRERPGRAEQVMQRTADQVMLVLPDTSRGKLGEVIFAHGETLTHAVVTAIAGVLPPSRVRFVAPVLKLLAEVDASTCSQWMESSLRRLPVDAHIDAKQFVTVMFSHEGLHDDKEFLKAAEIFSSACRRKRVF